MSGDVQLELWLHEYKMKALSSVLEEQGTSVEKQMQEMLFDLYEEQVPAETRQEIRARIDAEYAAAKAEEEAARKYTVFRVRENGADSFFQLERKEDLLGIGKYLRQHLLRGQGSGASAFQAAFAGLKPITAEQYSQLMTDHLENPNRVTGVFDLNFNKQEVSTVAPGRSWRTYSIKDISSAVYSAYRKSGLGPFQYEARFENSLNGKARPSAGHLSALEISFAEELSEINGLLNVYMETSFDVDAVFGTHVCTGENDDTLNVYANYDMTAGQVCDELEVDLHWADGREEAVEYRLNAVEKAVLLRKMDEYCQQQTGQTLADYSAQLLAEDMAPPTAPSM
ncbi:MAG: hypothetical protein K2L38_06400 [Dysosmobacter sp.]|nr:hypothetical protein [Dysosmobacter sp.]